MNDTVRLALWGGLLYVIHMIAFGAVAEFRSDAMRRWRFWQLREIEKLLRREMRDAEERARFLALINGEEEK